MTQSDDQQRILDYYEDPYHRGSCDGPTHMAEASSEACGDVVAVEIRVVGDLVEEIWFDGEGCKISQGAASIFAEHLEGQSVLDIVAMSDEQARSIVDLPENRDCCVVGFRAIRLALEQVSDEDSLPAFSGPDLGDEC